MSDTTSGSWDEPRYTSFLLWDIDREFQNAYEAYEEWLAKNRRKRAVWRCIVGSHEEDALAKTLSLGRRVQKCIEEGQEEFGSRFDRGDSPCHTILSAQLLRLQHEVNVPLWDCLHSRIPLSVPYDDLLKTAKSVRRACLHALQDQHARLATRSPTPYLPPPRFSVTFCPYALQLQKDKSKSSAIFQMKKVRPHDRYDEREICPYCDIHIFVTAHSGLPHHRRLLFQSHISQPSAQQNDRATFACSSCYKTFDDSYAFLDHIFQKEIGSERSCLRRWSTTLNITSSFMKSDPALVQKCLRNCLQREMKRTNLMNKSSREVQFTIRPVDSRYSTNVSRRG